MLSLAADVLEANPADLELGGGVISVRGTPSVELAGGAGEDHSRRSRADFPDGAENELKVTRTFDGGESGWSAAPTAARWR